MKGPLVDIVDDVGRRKAAVSSRRGRRAEVEFLPNHPGSQRDWQWTLFFFVSSGFSIVYSTIILMMFRHFMVFFLFCFCILCFFFFQSGF